MRVVTNLLPLLLTVIPARGFVPSLPRSHRVTKLGSNPESSEPIEYNDFDFVVGSDQHVPNRRYLSSHPGLQRRLQELQATEERQQSQTLINRQEGNAQVRGFAIDGSEQEITKLAVVQEDDEDGAVVVLVGRANGSLSLVQLGTDVWTQLSTTRSRQQPDRLEESLPTKDPSIMLASVQSPSFDAICSILTAQHQIVWTGQTSGHLQQWKLVHENDAWTLVPLSTTLSNVHGSSPILTLNLLDHTQQEEPSFVVSVSANGVVALWDYQSGHLLASYETQHQVAAANVDVRHGRIYLGLADGHVEVYSVIDLMQGADGNLEPNARFLAHPDGITAIAVAGEGTLGRRDKEQLENCVLLTGSSGGLVKQWELVSRPGGKSNQLDHWPRLATQRLPKRAHLFPTNDACPICTIVPMDNNTLFATATTSGTIRTWNPQTGDEQFRFDGFESPLTSLCSVFHQNAALLITNGMQHLVCVHDFQSNQSEDDGLGGMLSEDE